MIFLCLLLLPLDPKSPNDCNLNHPSFLTNFLFIATENTTLKKCGKVLRFAYQAKEQNC